MAESNISTKKVLVTPALAEEWLKRNTRNRKIREKRIMDFVGLIK